MLKNNILGSLLWTTLLFSFFVVSYSDAETMNREEFEKAVKGSFHSDDGYFGTNTGDKAKFTQYICEHWKDIMREYIPNYHNSDGPNKTLTIDVIRFAAEDLPPLEYLDFLENLLDMEDQGKLPRGNNSLMLDGRNKKSSFLEVNWQYPRVQAILKRAIKLFSNDKVAVAAFEATASGKLADNYRNGVSDDAPDPETLPGIKLQRPWGSLIRKYEWLTGKKVPPDPKYDPRTDRRGHTASVDPKEQVTAGLWPWFALGGVLIGVVFFLKKKRGDPKSR